MKFIVNILVIILTINVSLDASILDSLKVRDIETEWEEKEGYSKSNITLHPYAFNMIEQDNELNLYSWMSGGHNMLTISKETGNVESIHEIYFQHGKTLVAGKQIGNTEKLYLIKAEMNEKTNKLLRIDVMTQDNENLDTLFSRVINEISLPTWDFSRTKLRTEFFITKDEKIFLQLDLLEKGGYYNDYIPRPQTFIIDIPNDKIYSPGPINETRFTINYDNNTLLTSYDTGEPIVGFYKYYDLNGTIEEPFNTYSNLGDTKGSHHTQFINDSLASFVHEDSLYIHNYKDESIKVWSFPIEEGVLGSISLEEKFLLLDTKDSNDNKHRKVIYTPTMSLFIDTVINKPFQGRILTQLNDGKLLSIGEDHILYKSDIMVDFDFLKADFVYEKVGDTYFFTNTSEGPLERFTWIDHNGNENSEKNPVITFKNNGQKKITLIVENAFGSRDTISKTIDFEKSIKAIFTCSRTVGKAPLEVRFVDKTILEATKYIWNFGDSGYSYEDNPTHIFSKPGKYDISLTVFDKNGNHDILLLEDFITVEE